MWQSPGYSEMSEKQTNALTNRPELLGDCHDQCAHWSRNDSSNERLNNNLSSCRRKPLCPAKYSENQLIFIHRCVIMDTV